MRKDKLNNIPRTHRSVTDTPARQGLVPVLVATVFTMAAITVHARQPRLVVGIMVDGLQQEQIDRLRAHLTDGGFNRFLRDGVVIENLDYGTSLDAAAATAVVMTGASPSVNGIAGAWHYDPRAKRYESSVLDRGALGNYTDETYSPRALRVTTLSDEARIAGSGIANAYALAADPAQAIIMGGHAGNSAAWLNEKTGNWASSAFYGDMPTVLETRNRMTPLSTRLENQLWEPSETTANVAELPAVLTKHPFKYAFTSSVPDRYARFIGSPLANTEITQIANEYLTTLGLGQKEGTTDMLNIAYTLQPYEFSRTPESRYELTDSYIRLDADLASLLTTIDQRVGRANTVVFLAATPPSARRRRDDKKWNIPVGEFSTRKAAALLNLYLIATHGNGDWVKAIADNQFYLNDELAKSRDVDMHTLRQEVAQYLKRMAGVDRASSIDDVLDASTGYDDAGARRRNTVVSVAGDVLIDLLPGWELIDDYNNRTAHSGQVNVNALTTAPAYILAPDTEHRIIKSVIDARVLAPTVAGQMHIRSPNGAALPPLRF